MASSLLNFVGERQLESILEKRGYYMYANIYDMILRRASQMMEMFIEDRELRVNVKE